MPPNGREATGAGMPTLTPTMPEWFEGFGTPGEALLGTGETLVVTLALGSHVLTLRTTDQGGLSTTDTLDVTVVDTTPPSLLVAFDPAVLWPPNHRMVRLDAAVTAADACGTAVVSLLSLSSDEPDDAPGNADGATTNDIQGAVPGTDDVAFDLRAERSANGPGRTYTATYRAIDLSGNARDVGAVAFVPHDQGGVTEPLILQASETPAGTVLDWPDLGPGVSYRAVGGDLRFLQTMGQDPSATIDCIASGLTQSDTIGFEDPRVPAPGAAFFYLVEYDDGQARGYGTESTFWDRDAALGMPCP